jgi:hypothetical protein
MGKLVVVIFPDEAKTHQGTRALTELHAEGSITLYASAIIARDPGGKLSVQKITHEGLVDKISRELAPGKAAVVADVADDGVISFEARMETMGGIVSANSRPTLRNQSNGSCVSYLINCFRD